MKKIEIRRFGNYINSVEGEEALREWIIENVRDKKTEETKIKADATYEECMEIAKKEHYTFFNGGLERTNAVLKRVKIERVAQEIVGAQRRGETYVADCPMCGTKNVLAISPKYQMYKCFGCDDTGNVIRLVMKVKGLTHERAVEFLENNFIKK